MADKTDIVEQKKLNIEQRKAQQELIETQKGMSDKFRALTSSLAEMDSDLGQHAANIRKNTKDTFIGMLRSRKLSEVMNKQKHDAELTHIKNARLNAISDAEIEEKRFNDSKEGLAMTEAFNKEAIEKEQKALDDKIAKQAIRGDVEKKDFEKLQVLRKAMQDAESNGLETVRMANGQMQNMTDAKKVLQEQENKVQENHNKTKEAYAKNQEKIDNKFNAFKEKNADELKVLEEDEKNRLKLHNQNLEMLSLSESETLDRNKKELDAVNDEESRFVGFSDSLKSLTGGLVDLNGWADDATKFVNDVHTVMKGIVDGISSIPSLMRTIGGKIADVSKKLFSMLPDSIQEKLVGAWKFMSGGLKKMGKGFLRMGKQFLRGAARLAVSAATLVAGMLATAASVLISGIVMMAPAILIGLAVAALIFGVMYLAKKFEENKDMIMFKWGLIQEAFSIAIDGLVLWKDKAVAFIGNIFSNIWMSIKSLFSSIMTGIENGINFAIQGINSFLPKRFQIDEVDIGAKAMAKGVQEEKAALAIQQEKEQKEFADRAQALETRKEVMQQGFIDGPPPKSGEEIADGTTELKQAEEDREKTTAIVANSVSDNSTNSSVTNVLTSPQTTRNDDSTASRAGVSGRFTYG